MRIAARMSIAQGLEEELSKYDLKWDDTTAVVIRGEGLLTKEGLKNC